MNLRMSIKNIFLLVLFFSFIQLKGENISFKIVVNSIVLSNPMVSHSVNDAVSLLKNACNCPVSINGEANTAYDIVFPKEVKTDSIKANFSDQSRNYPYLYYPEHHYKWIIETKENKGSFKLESPTHQGVSAGVYGLLQELLGFKFYHPKEIIIPTINHESLPKGKVEFSAQPKFEKKGFHLHTMHPLELTEQLLDHTYKNGIEDIKEYIDWLARNQQNYFEFNLLESIKIKEWVPYIKQAVEYMHERGIVAGLDLSLSMKQQKAFALYNSPPKSFRSKKKQIKRNVDRLCEADWDVWSVEFSSTEFTSGNVKKKMDLQLYLNSLLIEKGVFLTGRKHVVRDETLVDKGGEVELVDSLDKYRGTMSHTVMFYSAVEEQAPVYGNENLKHMYDFILKEQGKREVWYYPESAYWITFDNSIPMFLMPYLSARLEDLQEMEKLGLEGHLTFSSGWEWGYWLFDWSIARWSWHFTQNEEELDNYPTQYLDELFPQENLKTFFKEQLDLQQTYIKDSNMIQYLAASSVTDEMWGKLNLPLQPRPQWKYKWLMNKSDKEAVDLVSKKHIPLLQNFAFSSFGNALSEELDVFKDNLLFQELLDGIKITALRSSHRAKTLEGILAYRQAEDKKQKQEVLKPFLEEAKQVREFALEIVKSREKQYRYPYDLIAGKRWDHTCYHFGYLYTVSDLHFWKREESQIQNNKWSPFYLNIYHIPRTVGLVD